jgi:hypothetical protein
MPSKELIDRFLSQRHIAFVGPTCDTKEFANSVYRRLRDDGRTMYPVTSTPRPSKATGRITDWPTCPIQSTASSSWCRHPPFPTSSPKPPHAASLVSRSTEAPARSRSRPTRCRSATTTAWRSSTAPARSCSKRRCAVCTACIASSCAGDSPRDVSAPRASPAGRSRRCPRPRTASRWMARSISTWRTSSGQTSTTSIAQTAQRATIAKKMLEVFEAGGP